MRTESGLCSMKRVCLIVVLAVGDLSLGADLTERQIVEKAIKAEVDAFEDIEARWKKKALKASERVAVFGKKKLSDKDEAERINELRRDVAAGRASCRILSLSLDSIEIGQSGVLAPNFQRIRCSTAAESVENAFYGSFSFELATIRNGIPIGESRQSRDFYFANVPGAEQLVSGKEIEITAPMIVISRHTYLTNSGLVTTFKIECLSAAVERIRLLDAAKKKPPAKQKK